MALCCPRCAAELTAQQITPVGADRAETVHVCENCDGLWLDRRALPVICPTLAHLPERRMEVALAGRAGKGIAACAACHAVPYEVDVLEVAIDFCTTCKGVWLDGGEYDESQIGEATEYHRPRGGPYRQPADDLERSANRCVHCGDTVEPDDGFMREHGLTCGPCHYALERKLQALRGEEGPLAGLLGRVSDILLELMTPGCD